MKLSAQQARALLPMTAVDSILSAIYERIASIARDNRRVLILTKDQLNDVAQWHLAERASLRYEGPASEVALNLRQQGYTVEAFESPADGILPAWIGMKVSW